MRGYAHACEHCADIVRQHAPVDARRLITEYIQRLNADLLKCDGGNFYIEQQIVAARHILNGLYSLLPTKEGIPA